MPVVHILESIKILLYFDDHLPPHFHAQYNEYELLVEIETLDVYAGYLPTKQQKRVMAWASEHQDFLLEKWNEYHNS